MYGHRSSHDQQEGDTLCEEAESNTERVWKSEDQHQDRTCGGNSKLTVYSSTHGMNYTDQEILDLESSLEEVGHSKQVTFLLVEPDGWKNLDFGRFGPFLENAHGKELAEQGLTTGTSMILIPGDKDKSSRSVLRIMGPAIRASKALDELYEKYNCTMALDFTE